MVLSTDSESSNWSTLHEAIHSLSIEQDDLNHQEAEFLRSMKERNFKYHDLARQIHSLQGWINLMFVDHRKNRRINQVSTSPSSPRASTSENTAAASSPSPPPGDLRLAPSPGTSIAASSLSSHLAAKPSLPVLATRHANTSRNFPPKEILPEETSKDPLGVSSPHDVAAAEAEAKAYDVGDGDDEDDDEEEVTQSQIFLASIQRNTWDQTSKTSTKLSPKLKRFAEFVGCLREFPEILIELSQVLDQKTPNAKNLVIRNTVLESILHSLFTNALHDDFEARRVRRLVAMMFARDVDLFEQRQRSSGSNHRTKPGSQASGNALQSSSSASQNAPHTPAPTPAPAPGLISAYMASDSYNFFPRHRRRPHAHRRRTSSRTAAASTGVEGVERQRFARELLVAYFEANRGEAMPSLTREFSKVVQGVLADGLNVSDDQESRDYVCNKLIRILQQWDFRQSPELVLMIAQFLELLREVCPAELYASRRGTLVNALLFDHYLYEAFRDPLAFRMCSLAQMNANSEARIEALLMSFRTHVCAEGDATHAIVEAVAALAEEVREMQALFDEKCVSERRLPTFDTVCISLQEMITLHRLTMGHLSQISRRLPAALAAKLNEFASLSPPSKSQNDQIWYTFIAPRPSLPEVSEESSQRSDVPKSSPKSAMSSVLSSFTGSSGGRRGASAGRGGSLPVENERQIPGFSEYVSLASHELKLRMAENANGSDIESVAAANGAASSDAVTDSGSLDELLDRLMLRVRRHTFAREEFRRARPELPDDIVDTVYDYAVPIPPLAMALATVEMVKVMLGTDPAMSYLASDDNILAKVFGFGEATLRRFCLNEHEYGIQMTGDSWTKCSNFLVSTEVVQRLCDAHAIPVGILRQSLAQWLHRYRTESAARWAHRKRALLAKAHRQRTAIAVARTRCSQDKHLLFLVKVFFFRRFTEVQFHAHKTLKVLPPVVRRRHHHADSRHDGSADSDLSGGGGGAHLMNSPFVPSSNVHLAVSARLDRNSSFGSMNSSRGSVDSTDAIVAGGGGGSGKKKGSVASMPPPTSSGSRSSKKDRSMTHSRAASSTSSLGSSRLKSGSSRQQPPQKPQPVGEISVQFVCNSVDEFISTYLDWHYVLKLHRKETAEIWHSFLAKLEIVVGRDKSFSDQERRPVVELVESYVMGRLYSYLFPVSDRLRLEAEICEQDQLDIETDQRFYDKVITLDWVVPQRDLGMEFCPPDPKFWELPVQSIKSIDSFRSPKDKLVCLTNALKWCVKKLEHGLGHTPGADHTLPALIWVLIKAQPRHLHANLTYIQTFRRSQQMMSVEGYSHAQIMQAYLWILERLKPDNGVR